MGIAGFQLVSVLRFSVVQELSFPLSFYEVSCRCLISSFTYGFRMESSCNAFVFFCAGACSKDIDRTTTSCPAAETIA